MFTHGLQDIAHLLTLPLGSDVGSDPLLQELEAPLVFGNTQQLHSAFFIRREPCDLPNQVANKLVMVGLLAFAVCRLLFYFIESGLVSLVETGANLVFRSHSFF